MSAIPLLRRLTTLALASALVFATAGPTFAMMAVGPRPCATTGSGHGHCARGFVTAACCCGEATPATPLAPQLQPKDMVAAAALGAAQHVTVALPARVWREAPRHGYHSADLHTLFATFLI